MNLTYDVPSHLEGSCLVASSLNFSSFFTGKKNKPKQNQKQLALKKFPEYWMCY